MTYFLTSSSTDLGPWGNLRAGAGDSRKPSKGPEAVLGVDGKMHSAWNYDEFPNKNLFHHHYIIDQAKLDHRNKCSVVGKSGKLVC